jgi:anti-sigma B factor antagonist
MAAPFRTETTGEILTVFLTEVKILDETVISQLSTALSSLISKTSEPNVVLDFSGVKFMSSSALGMLVKINKQCKEFKINLKLCSIHKDIAEVFKITRLDKVLALYPDAPSAYEAFKKTGLFFRK